MDVFAWGCLIALLASGVHPFAGRSEQEWILRLQSAQPDLFGLPPGLDNLIRAALARRPQDRPTARELAAICRDRDDEHRYRPYGSLAVAGRQRGRRSATPRCSLRRFG